MFTNQDESEVPEEEKTETPEIPAEEPRTNPKKSKKTDQFKKRS